MTLKRFFHENPKIALGFSGGVDSSFLLYSAVKYGADVKPYFIKTVLQPLNELNDARQLAEYLGVTVTVIELDVLAKPEVRKNKKNRCYHCRKEMFGKLIDLALLDGYPIWVDGGNASEEEGDPLGRQALLELGVRSPLRECGITKDEVRRLSKEAGLFTWNKPSCSCLATRIPTGRNVTPESLKKVEKAENILLSYGFRDLQVRLIGDYARIQLPEEQMEPFMAKRKEILSDLMDFKAVFLDLTGHVTI